MKVEYPGIQPTICWSH